MLHVIAVFDYFRGGTLIWEVADYVNSKAMRVGNFVKGLLQPADLVLSVYKHQREWRDRLSMLFLDRKNSFCTKGDETFLVFPLGRYP